MDDRDIETGLPFDSAVDTAVERWFREHFHAASALGFPMAAYVSERGTQRRLRDWLADTRQQLDEASDRAERADQTIANSAEIITARDARIRELEAELAWNRPEAINAATGAPHHVLLGPDGPTGIRHNLGCYQCTGRGRGSQRGDLICQFSAYLDQTDTDEHPEPGKYIVTVDVYGRSEEDVDATWIAVGSDRLAARVAELEAEQGRADTRLRVEHYRLQARNSEARALANGWRTYTLQQRGEDGEWIAMREAFGAILAALDGDADERGDGTGGTTRQGHDEARTPAPYQTRRPAAATLAADMCPRCKGDNEDAWALCQSCAETKQQGHDTTTSEGN